MEEDSAGFAYPKVNDKKCTDCGLCSRSCPSVSIIEKGNTSKVYAACSKNRNILVNSNSRGAFSEIASWCISEKKGYVYGAAFDEDLSVHHIQIDALDQLYRLQGSKYVQSECYNSFGTIKLLLLEKKYVVFCGTGCQIAGLRKFVGKCDET